MFFMLFAIIVVKLFLENLEKFPEQSRPFINLLSFLKSLN